MRKNKAPITANCYSCQQPFTLLVLPRVRRTKCPGCGAVHPSLSARAVAEFFNADKQIAAFM